MNQIPEKVVNFNAYNNVNKLIGVTGEVTLPNLEPMTETISGAGLLGEYESVSQGHFGSTPVEIQFRTLTDQSFSMQEMAGQVLTLRAAQQGYDVSKGVVSHRALKITLKGQPKGINPGKIGVNAATETTTVLEATYIKIEENGKVLLELDKINFIYVVNGKDQLAALRNMI